MLLHDGCGLCGQRIGAHRARARVHDLLRTQAAQILSFFYEAAQVAIGEDAANLTLRIDHGRSAQALGAHLAHELGKRRLQPHLRHCLSAAHDIAHMGQQLSAQGASGVRAGKVLSPKAARVEQGHGQGIAHGQLRRGAGRRRKIERASLLLHTAVEHDIGMAGQL